MDKKQLDFMDAQLGYWRAGPTLGKAASDHIDKLADSLLRKEDAKRRARIKEINNKNKGDKNE